MFLGFWGYVCVGRRFEYNHVFSTRVNACAHLLLPRTKVDLPVLSTVMACQLDGGIHLSTVGISTKISHATKISFLFARRHFHLTFHMMDRSPIFYRPLLSISIYDD